MPITKTTTKTNPVKLYKPQLYGARPSSDSSVTACIGGGASDRLCMLCQRPSVRLLHFPLPGNKNALQVYACNHLPCWQRLFNTGNEAESNFSVGGNGIVQASVVVQEAAKTAIATAAAAAAPLEDWTGTTTAPNEWETTSNTAESLEAQLAAVEQQQQSPTKSRCAPQTSKGDAAAANNNTSTNAAASYYLHMVPEPLAVHPVTSSSSTKQHHPDNDKIQAMLDKYLAEEEDADLVAMLQNGGSTVSAVPCEAEEEEEMLSPDQLAFLAYAERVQRVPQQVLRVGGAPIWSVCADPPPEIPPSSHCGEDLFLLDDDSTVSCMQLLPSLLQVLKLDDTAANASANDDCNDRGMDWGAIVVLDFTSSSGANQPVVIVQRSTEQQRIEDLQGEKREQFLLPPATIADGTQFSDDDDDE